LGRPGSEGATKRGAGSGKRERVREKGIGREGSKKGKIS